MLTNHVLAQSVATAQLLHINAQYYNRKSDDFAVLTAPDGFSGRVKISGTSIFDVKVNLESMRTPHHAFINVSDVSGATNDSFDLLKDNINEAINSNIDGASVVFDAEVDGFNFERLSTTTSDVYLLPSGFPVNNQDSHRVYHLSFICSETKVRTVEGINPVISAATGGVITIDLIWVTRSLKESKNVETDLLRTFPDLLFGA